MKPLAIDLFAGLGGWSEGLLAEDWDVIGFDIERHEFDGQTYPAQLVLQDVLTLHGSQFRNVDLIVASPPCQFFSYTAMPWSLAKARAAETRASPELMQKELALFNACFRIQREIYDVSGRHVPLIVENVKGAVPWVGQPRWRYGSYYLWGDVPALMPFPEGGRKGGGSAGPGDRPDRRIGLGQWRDGIKCGGDWFSADDPSPMRNLSSRSPRRKKISALIAKVPFALARHIGWVFHPPVRA